MMVILAAKKILFLNRGATAGPSKTLFLFKDYILKSELTDVSEEEIRSHPLRKLDGGGFLTLLEIVQRQMLSTCIIKNF
jgi:hypothetical protein